MSFEDSSFMGQIEDQQRAHIILAGQMIRKYWGNSFFHSLEGDKAVLSFAKKFATKIDRLEAIAEFFGTDYAQFSLAEGETESIYAENRNLFEVQKKVAALSTDTRKELLLTIDTKTIELINCLPKKSLNIYILIAHNEGIDKAEEIRNEASLVEYKTPYLAAYQHNADTQTHSIPFSKTIGAFGIAA